MLCVCPADTLARAEGTAPVKDSGIIGMPFGAPSHHYIVESISEFALERGEPRWGTWKEWWTLAFPWNLTDTHGAYWARASDKAALEWIVRTVSILRFVQYSCWSSLGCQNMTRGQLSSSMFLKQYVYLKILIRKILYCADWHPLNWERTLREY